MAKEKMTGSAGAEVPKTNIKLGEIATASIALGGGKGFEEGYPDNENALHMRNLAGSKVSGGKK